MIPGLNSSTNKPWTLSAALALVVLGVAGCNSLAPGQPENWRNHRVHIDHTLLMPKTLNEISGLAWHDGFWAQNDSGNPPTVFKVQKDLHQPYPLKAVNFDWEALADDANNLYVFDCGNNFGDRKWFQFYTVSWSNLTSGSKTPIEVEKRSFRFADTTPKHSLNNHNQDCEAATMVDGKLWVFSKDWQDYRTRIYQVEPQQTRQDVSPFQTLPVDGLVTGADYDPVTHQLALVGYTLYKLGSGSFIWTVPVTNHRVNWKAAKGYRLEPSGQWEGVLWHQGELYISSENSILGPAQIAHVPLKTIDF